ncbi:hypothetical protein [Methanobrevibacter arboriphilus]|uniref:hypothetical protein n=1 Tax=Methanobrevibacter arboriphilus TaxID=39441 RepID=UPI001CDAE70D|nr:hypothetical protein [Methanobrevibacter arboriphilus]
MNLKKLADYYRRPPMMFFNNNSPSYNEDKIVDFRTKGSKQKKKSISSNSQRT